MKLTKTNIVARINRLLVSYKVNWEDVVDDLDMAVDEINTYMSTKYPPVSEILHEFSRPDATYSYRAGGIDIEFFPQKYFLSIVIPFAVTAILKVDEEFTTVFNIYMSQYQENLFVMARDEMSNIPAHLFSAPKGVYFANPNPVFKADPEGYFNRQIEMEVPKLKVTYSWGDIKLGQPGLTTFVSKPLPVDNNSYEIGSSYMPVIMQSENFDTFIVDSKGSVLAKFVGWTLVENDETEIVEEAIIMNGDLNFYAIFDYNIVTFKYNGNGGAISNWRPMFLNSENIPEDGVQPTGGTASRKGYNFISFEPVSYSKQEILTMIEEMNDPNQIDAYSETMGLVFEAQWELVNYYISYVNVNPDKNYNKKRYFYGEEFDLLPVESIKNSTDEFIGWFDNSELIGDPITKVNESDYGNKIFYADYNDIGYRITWKDFDNSTLLSATITRGTLLVPPTMENIYDVIVDGKVYTREFVGFRNEENEIPTKAIKNDTFIATYLLIPKQVTVYVYYLDVEEETGTLLERIFPLYHHEGSSVSQSTIISELGANGQYYDSVGDTNKYIEMFSDVAIDSTTTISGDITISDQMVLYGVYTTEICTIVLNRMIEDTENAGTLIDDSEYSVEVKIPKGSTISAMRSILPYSSDGVLVVMEVNGVDNWIQNFEIVGTIDGYLDVGDTQINGHEALYEEDTLTTMITPQLGKIYLDTSTSTKYRWSGTEYYEVDSNVIIASDLTVNSITIKPIYGTTINPVFKGTLTVSGYPMAESQSLYNKAFENIPLYTEIDVIDLIKDTANADDTIKYLKIRSLWAAKQQNPITGSLTYYGEYTDTVKLKLSSNRTIYALTESKALFNVYIHDGYNERIVKTPYPYEFAINGNGTLDLVPETLAEGISPTFQAPAGHVTQEYIFYAWTRDGYAPTVYTNQSLVSMLNIGIINEDDIHFYPLFKYSPGYVIKTFFLCDNAPLKTNFFMGNPGTVDIELSAGAYGENDSRYLLSFDAVMRTLNGGNASLTPQQRGYGPISILIPTVTQGLMIGSATTIAVTLPKPEAELITINVTFNLMKLPGYYWVEIYPELLATAGFNEDVENTMLDGLSVTNAWDHFEDGDKPYKMGLFIYGGNRDFLIYGNDYLNTAWFQDLPRLKNPYNIRSYREQESTYSNMYYFREEWGRTTPVSDTQKLTSDRTMYLVWRGSED